MVSNGRCLAVEFYDALPDQKDRKRVRALWEWVSVHGIPRNTEKSNDLGGGIFELKPTSQIRLLYFYDGRRRIVMTHGVVKKTSKMDPREIVRANKLRSEYQTR